MIRPIAISLSPNTQLDDVFLAFKTLLSPWKWNDKIEVESLEEEFAHIFGNKYKALAVNSGRSAEYLILKALGIGKGNEVIVQGFTCVAVPNSIIWLGAKPVFVDIDKTYNIDPVDLKKKITDKTRAIIVQHTFGIPANIEKIKQIADKKHLPIIEDCAHALGAEHEGKLLGTFSEVAFFSFGRDKIISSVFGGMILCSNELLYKKIKRLRDDLKNPSKRWIFQQLFHPVAFSLILPVYNLVLGKLIIVLLQKFGFLGKAVYNKEKTCDQPAVFPSQTPGGLAVLARNQLAKLKNYNSHRKRISKIYFSKLKNVSLELPTQNAGAVWLRFPVRHKCAKSLYQYAKKEGILLGDWYRGVVMPARNMALVGYRKGSCPMAEKYAESIVNLPTYPTLRETNANRVVKVVKTWLNTQ